MYVSHIWDGQIPYQIQYWANGEAMALLNLYGLFLVHPFMGCTHPIEQSSYQTHLER